MPVTLSLATFYKILRKVDKAPLFHTLEADKEIPTNRDSTLVLKDAMTLIQTIGKLQMLQHLVTMLILIPKSFSATSQNSTPQWMEHFIHIEPMQYSRNMGTAYKHKQRKENLPNY